jgi:arylsulfatase A-like enzyme
MTPHNQARPNWRTHLGIVVLVGVGSAALAGWTEGLWVLSSEQLFGRYNELVAWAIAFDAGALIGFGLVVALVSEWLSRRMRRSLTSRALVSMHLGAAAFLLALGWGVWSQGLVATAQTTANFSGWIRQLPSLLAPAALVALLVGDGAWLSVTWLTTHRRFTRRLSARVWLVGEGILLLAALAFGLEPHWPGTTTLHAAPSADGAPQFNVIIVTIDTLRGDSIGLDGNATVQTPNLDQVGRSGTWFTNTIVQQPNTNASHTSIFTGVLPFVHGVRQHMIDTLAPNVQTLAEVLAARGYETAGLYSWVSLETGFSGLRGFQTYEDLSIQLTPALRDSRFQNLIVTYRLLGKYLLLPSVVESQFQDTQNAVEDTTDGKANVTTDAALRWLDANANSKPFFLWVHYYDPHYPYTPPPPFDTMYDPNYQGTVDGSMKTIHYIYNHNTGDLTAADVNHLRALYDGEISFTDQQLGRLMNELDQLGLNNRTIVVITGDHGESLGTDGRWFHGPRLNYSDIHVPLIIRFPPAIPANHAVTGPVSSIDIMPTILDLLHVPIPAQVQGQSLLPLISGAEQDGAREPVTMLDTYKQISLVTAQWQLIWDRSKNTSELYDYHSDPQELNNQALEQADVTAQLRQQLNQRLNELGFKGQ